MTEIEGNTNKWIENLGLWIGIITVKMSILPKMVYRFAIIPVKILMDFSQNRKQVLKFRSDHKRPLIVKAILSKKNKS